MRHLPAVTALAFLAGGRLLAVAHTEGLAILKSDSGAEHARD